jgi:hypothetical protein
MPWGDGLMLGGSGGVKNGGGWPDYRMGRFFAGNAFIWFVC